jgi:hypothetical protein
MSGHSNKDGLKLKENGMRQEMGERCQNQTKKTQTISNGDQRNFPTILTVKHPMQIQEGTFRKMSLKQCSFYCLRIFFESPPVCLNRPEELFIEDNTCTSIFPMQQYS